jgi:beta-lactamase superfamily II metal-dependent hydrolase
MAGRPGNRPQDPSDEGAAPISVHFLDMGEDKYGDCILVRSGARGILVDGGHPRDLTGQADTPSIPEQLESIFGHPPPFDLTLVVVTHGHNDHIGCLPEMIEQGIVRPDFALISDPSHCFPPGARDSAMLSDDLDADAAASVRRALAGLAEEDHSDLPERELELFLDRAAKLGTRYRAMIERLEKQGVPVIRWGISDIETLHPLYAALEGTGFDVLAPSIPHLELCRDQIVTYATDARDSLQDAVAQLGRSDSSPARLAAQLYRGAAADSADPLPQLDRKGQGSALNCQSIMLAFGEAGSRVLLTGDMQFAEPEVTGIDEHMRDLLRQVVEAGPYRCVKLPHHSSYNGITPELWERLGKPPLLVHSGGSNDPSHPEPSMLSAFQGVDDEISFLRTDRNGLISIDLSVTTDPVRISRGEIDDYSANRRRRREEDVGRRKAEPARATVVERPPARAAAAVNPGPPQDSRIEVVVVRRPLDPERKIGRATIEVRRSGRAEAPHPAPAPAGDPAFQLGGGRRLPRLLFVTPRRGLARKIGKVEADRAITLIEQSATLLDIDGKDPFSAVRAKLGEGGFSGIVLVGGYDILEAQRVNVLDEELAEELDPDDLSFDPDDFIVWSDDAWGDLNGDGMADLPVSRIPDGRSADLVLAALTADGIAPEGAFGIRNAERPFADRIYRLIDENPVLKCVPTRVSELAAGASSKRQVYFMLHGDDRDAARFWGDDRPNRRVVEAINVGALPTSGLDVVFAGCCWGALTVLQRANRPDSEIAPRSPEESMALACLRAGARAFVGCTGVHYSPGPQGGFFGAPMHEAFWRELNGGKAPAEALFAARTDYLADMPHGRTDPREIAIERKIYKQFTCLGLGW